MRKIITIVMAGMLTLSLAACGNSAEQVQQPASQEATSQEAVSQEVTTSETENSVSEPESTQEVQTETTEQTTETASEQPEENAQETDTGKVLVAYFSWSGNTQQLAEMIQQETDADLFEIVPETPYTEDYNTLLDVAQQEKSDNARPAVAGQVENWADYNTIFIGYPNWWSDAPRVILTFLETYDCTGKTIIPFCTSGGGGFGASRSSIADSAAGATVAEGFHVGGSGVGNAEADVAAWVEGLNLTE